MAKDQALLPTAPRQKPPERMPIERGPDVGDLLGRCLLIERLGRGGACTVFRALHQTLNVTVAVKVLQLDAGAAHCLARDQMRTEARLLAQLSHPNIVRVLDFEDDPVLPYLVLECIEGPCLNELIQQSGRLALDRACQIVGQVVDALGVLWQLGAVHRDVKPGNILLDKDGVARLADFGQAVLIEEQEIADPQASPPQRDDLSGTAAYLAPEQFLAPASVDHRTDLYALGATFYHAVTGKLPFTGRSRMEVMLKHTREMPPPPHEVVPGLPAEVSDIILTLMAKQPDDRYQDGDELVEALNRLCQPAEPAAAEPGPEPEPEPDAAAEKPPLHRPLGRAPLPAGEPALVPPARRPNDKWMDFVKRTLASSAGRKRDD